MDRSILRNNIIFWSRLGFGIDPVTTDENGDPVIFDSSFSQLRFHQDFYRQGVKLHSFILNSGWVGDGKFNFSTTDATMDAAVQIGPDAMLIPRIKLNAPIEWCRNNPEEVFVYPDGPRDAESIRALVGTPEHDYLGYEAPDGVYMGDPKYQRKNVNGKICLQSFSSDKWLEAAREAIQKIVLHLEEKYPGRILGYHVTYGISGETIQWGRMNKKYGDYGITNQRKFREYLIEHGYPVEELPSPAVRYDQTGNMVDFLRVNNKISRYYDEFTNAMNSRAVEYLCKAVKDVAPDRLTGVFYGYFMGVENIAYTGHTEIEKLLNSPYVDFFAAPKTYFRCRPGDACAEYGCTQSVNLKKVWVDECDVRTHLAVDVPEHWRSDNMHQTENALTRELAKNLSHDSGFWFMDLGGNWYDSEEMMQLVGRLNRINERVRKTPHKSVSDVLLLVDEKVFSMTSISSHFLRSFTSDFICNTKMSGSSLDIFRFNDIYSIDLSQYKLIVFANTLKMTCDQLDYIKSKTNAAFCFNYASGCETNGEFSFDNTKALTGFTLTESTPLEYDFPTVRIMDTDNIIRKDNSGEVVYKEVDGRLHFMNSIPYLDIASIREIERIAGAHNYCDANYTLYTDNRFLALTASPEAFTGTLDFGEVKSWHNVNTGECGRSRVVNISMQPYDTAVYLFD